ncbi:enolase C-terminal domain-like protein [Citricoccus sp. NR2]|uniref:enolase C-terminal domain-like protein n=1 Tax=Citricoccus sp. NR2 TaxID=3004095 RepID=UPI0022DE486A|nr:enolase C-terminal domain-like protein [Citricoccus sp. NR2]WBL19778.1 acylphosphatase [Citricoccus sp. NR2]
MNTTLNAGDASNSDQSGTHHDSLLITRSRVLSYRVPTAGSQLRPTNFVVELQGKNRFGDLYLGLGESQPRGARTGDDVSDSWPFLVKVAESVEGERIDLTSTQSALDSIKGAMARFVEMARVASTQEAQRRPFRGTLLGVEVALLDVTARALGLTVAKLLGQQNETAPLAPTALSRKLKGSSLSKEIRDQGELYGALRLPPRKTIDNSISYFERVYGIAKHPDVSQAGKPLWVDFNGALSRKDAEQMVRRVAAAVGERRLPKHVILEQPVPSRYGDHLPKLQKLADDELATYGRPDSEIRIMIDESVWDKHSIGRLKKIGPIRAVNIRPAQAGGLIPSIELAEAAKAANPDVVIVLTRMIGASRLTSAAMRNLALATPEADAATISSTVEKDINLTIAEVESESARVQRKASAEDAVSISKKASRTAKSSIYRGYFSARVSSKKRFRVRNEVGLGFRLDYSSLIKPTINMATYPVPTPPRFEGKTAKTYSDVDYIRPLGPYGVHGHLVEREALARGLNTRRFSKSTFMADDGIQQPVSFRTARWPLTSAVASSIVRHKETTRLLLNRRGVPVPQGRTFAQGDIHGALSYANRIGYPVVLKPAEGSMGVGVTANIANDDELRSALQRLENSVLGTGEFIVEQHVRGKDYRIMVIGDEVIAAVERVPASVLGDGVSTVAELILEKNANRKLNPHLGPLKLKWNASVEHEIGKQGLNAESVLRSGQRLFLNSVNNLTQGGDSIEVLDELHPSIVQASIDAVAAVPGLTYCGVDFLLEDHTKPLSEQSGAVCELNAVAAIPVAEYPVFGTPRPLSERFLVHTVEALGLKAWEQRADSLNLHIKVRGKVTGVGYRQWFARRANQFGCSGWIRNVTGREVEIRVSGPTAAATALAMSAVLGPPRAHPTSVRTKHVHDALTGSFEIVSGEKRGGSEND